jgi:hypothetical protein
MRSRIQTINSDDQRQRCERCGQLLNRRSRQSHDHFFAVVDKMWTHLPEPAAREFPTPDHLRKWCLIRRGYCDIDSVSCSSKAEAARIAAFIRPMDHYAVVTVEGSRIVRYKARSQKMREMGKAQFERSKRDVFDEIASIIGVGPDELYEMVRTQ